MNLEHARIKIELNNDHDMSESFSSYDDLNDVWFLGLGTKDLKDTPISKSALLATCCHELGHILGQFLVDKAPFAPNYDFEADTQRPAVLKEEGRAWKIGQKVFDT